MGQQVHYSEKSNEGNGQLVGSWYVLNFKAERDMKYQHGESEVTKAIPKNEIVGSECELNSQA